MGGARHDGRTAAELRTLRLSPDFTTNPLASILCEVGSTIVLCTVCEEIGVPRFLHGTGKGWLTAEYSLLPGSTDTRVDREAARGKISGRTQEIQRLIGRSLRAVVDLSALGERTLKVDCDVLQADGGTRCASITGAAAALMLAIRRLDEQGAFDRSPLGAAVAAVSVGIVDGELLLDLDYSEDSRAEVDMNVVATGAGDFVEVQGTRESGTFSPAQLSGLTALALGGIQELIATQRKVVEGALGK